MRGDVISAVVNLHREGRAATPSIASAAAALDQVAAVGYATELVLVLDRPDEATRATARVAPATHQTQVVEVDHGDLGQSRNSGVAASRGDILAFLDADDLWGDEWLRRSAEMLEGSEPVVLHPEYSLIHGAVTRMVRHPDSTAPTFDLHRFRLHNAWTALSCARREVYSDVPFPANRLEDGFGFEDWSWNEEILRRGIHHRTVADTFHVIHLADDGSSLKHRSRAAVRSDWAPS